MSSVVWRDVHWYRRFSNAATLALLCFFSYGLVRYASSYTPLVFSLLIALELLLLYLLVVAVRTRLTYITTDGIMIGNAATDTYNTPPSRPAMFVRWNNVSRLTLRAKIVRHGWVSFRCSYLLAESVDGKRIETFIAQPERFQQALRTVRKNRLLVQQTQKERNSALNNSGTAGLGEWRIVTAWILLGLLALLWIRIGYGALSPQQLAIAWGVIGVPPLIYTLVHSLRRRQHVA